MHLKVSRTAVLVIALVTLIPGCRKKAPEFGHVTGVVRIDGKPRDRLLVRFLPDPEKGNTWPINATGKTDAQGKYSLVYAYEDKEGSGAPVGWHRVLIEDPALSQVPQGRAPPPQIIPPAYNSPASTPLIKEVKPGSQTIDLDIGK